MRFFNISQCPSLALPSQSPFSSRSNSNDPHSTPSGPQPSLLPSSDFFFPLFSILFCSSTSTCLSLCPPIYFPLIFSASLHPLTLSIFKLFFLSFAVHPFIPNPSVEFVFVSHPVRSAHTRLHTHTHSNDHIRQMTLITVRLECKNSEKRRPKHLLYIPSALRDSRLFCTRLSCKKLQVNTNSLPAFVLQLG